MFPLYPAQMLAEQKDLGDSAMGDVVHATVFVEQPITVQDQSSQTTYHPKNGEKACPCKTGILAVLTVMSGPDPPFD